MSRQENAAQPFAQRVDSIIKRVEACLDEHLAGSDQLSHAMAYSVFNGGKRLRPLLVHASGELLDIDPDLLLAPACAVELIHCYSLVHDDLPAMDDDALRRGRPTTHLQFDEATAILAGDALQAMAFEILASEPALTARPNSALRMCATLARACGAQGMAGGQALDLDMEGQRPDKTALEHMFALKTGALIRASILLPACLRPELPAAAHADLTKFADCLGLGFQICDDLLDIEGETAVIGKTAGADQALDKATWPALFGCDPARSRIAELAAEASICLDRVGGNTEALSWLTDRLLNRDR
ncbi:MAG: polyprenyl synthetase family protein [Wenzhouxiangella sp.]|nr:polyprenyl synthetase family protein [Wenzhouxiangella sp.]